MFYKQCLSRLYEGRGISSTLRRVFHTSVSNFPKSFPNPWDLATGMERFILVQYAKGNFDPFLRNRFKRGPGTKECPNVILSFFDKKLIGCHCHPDSLHIVWWWLHECYPRRCECNYWFVLKRVELPYLYEG